MIMIVDDDPAFLEEAEKTLDPGKGVFFAGSAEHARSLLSTVGAAFSVVMIDLDLPGVDGFALIREMRRNYPRLPVIAISGVFQPDVLESAKLCGAVETLRKPISPEWNSAVARARARVANG